MKSCYQACANEYSQAHGNRGRMRGKQLGVPVWDPTGVPLYDKLETRVVPRALALCSAVDLSFSPFEMRGSQIFLDSGIFQDQEIFEDRDLRSLFRSL